MLLYPSEALNWSTQYIFVPNFYDYNLTSIRAYFRRICNIFCWLFHIKRSESGIKFQLHSSTEEEFLSGLRISFICQLSYHEMKFAVSFRINIIHIQFTGWWSLILYKTSLWKKVLFYKQLVHYNIQSSLRLARFFWNVF